MGRAWARKCEPGGRGALRPRCRQGGGDGGGHRGGPGGPRQSHPTGRPGQLLPTGIRGPTKRTWTRQPRDCRSVALPKLPGSRPQAAHWPGQPSTVRARRVTLLTGMPLRQLAARSATSPSASDLGRSPGESGPRLAASSCYYDRRGQGTEDHVGSSLIANLHSHIRMPVPRDVPVLVSAMARPARPGVSN